MEDYRKKFIEYVQDQPLILDTRHPDYHNKDQRKQVYNCTSNYYFKVNKKINVVLGNENKLRNS